MTEKERLIELLTKVQYLGGLEEKIADYLIANGVKIPVRCEECKYNHGKAIFCENYIRCERSGTVRNKSYFCSYGERRADNG